ncbi:MAG: HPF/RaiA family ribosome-associated protein, partial [Planctomycetes bacterium]|nr:HPF/RaiA family ribosome-associated protein [Planctomycetota bacterium]
MRITIHHRLSEITEAGALELRRRAAFALGRFATRIEALSLRIRDVNGPRGGVGFSCLARVRLRRPATEIVASADAEDPLLGAA